MNKFLNTYITYRKKSYINTVSLYKTNEYKYIDFSDYNLNLSDYKLTSGYYDSKGKQGWWMDFYSSGYIWDLSLFKNNKIKKITYE